MELNSDRIMKENILKAMEKDQQMLMLLNAENELWRAAEISGRNNLNWEGALSTWKSAFPEIELELKGTCAKKDPTSEDLSTRLIPVPEENKTTTAWASGCLNERLVLIYGNQTRIIYLGGRSGFGEERNWTWSN
jgi:hypothetical protein